MALVLVFAGVKSLPEHRSKREQAVSFPIRALERCMQLHSVVFGYRKGAVVPWSGIELPAPFPTRARRPSQLAPYNPGSGSLLA